MKQRFVTTRTASPLRNIILSVLIFAAVVLMFWLMVDHLTVRTDRRERETLESAVNRSVTQCYALEGAYPQDLQYLKDNYGLIYDEETYIVHYQVMGENLLPSVTVLERRADE